MAQASQKPCLAPEAWGKGCRRTHLHTLQQVLQASCVTCTQVTTEDDPYSSNIIPKHQDGQSTTQEPLMMEGHLLTQNVIYQAVILKRQNKKAGTNEEQERRQQQLGMVEIQGQHT
ncbi:hypothetical protein P7K49_013222 [Saguinus oedipus]|uniref:Uncharacterized protein n=1 Tax=Saguinus oedipus TaxID=9490 RepID=A0ABQ9VFN4_SAGOE|nr:hypothetical protein P7K49_013222 [Saguinus oedipus]